MRSRVCWSGPSRVAHRPGSSNEERAVMALEQKTSRANHTWRMIANHTATGLAVLSTILVVAPLVAIFVYLLYKGASSLNLAFFTQVPKPVGETGGGMANAIVGSGILLALSSLLGVPVGI